jgi:hypothetical protein
MAAGCHSAGSAVTPQGDSPSLATAAEVQGAIVAGGLGPEIAEEASNQEGLALVEVPQTTIDSAVYTFTLGYDGYAVMVEADHLVLLCTAAGHFAVSGFDVREEDGQEVLSYDFWGGFGRRIPMRGQYVLGSGEPATWQFVD